MKSNRVMIGAIAIAASAPRGIVSGVRADGSNATQLVQQLQQAFATFKDEHTRQLTELKAGINDPLQASKVEKINADIANLQAAIDAHNTKMAAMEMGAGGARPLKDREYSEAFQAHMRRGDAQAALSKGAADDGGYTSPIEWDRTITDKLVIVSPMRALCSVQSVGGTGYKKLVNLRGTTSGWVGETDARDETNTPKLGEQAYGWGEIYANPSATQQMLDDSEINLEQWLAGEVDVEFAYQEGKAFVSGDGTKKPRGLLTYAAGGANLHPLGGIEVIGSGAVGAITGDSILDLVYALPETFTGNAKFAMNRNTMLRIRKLKDSDGNYLWQPSLQAGQPSTLAGYAIADIPDMPGVAANALSIAFGDFKRAYKILDRVGVRVLRDPYTKKPYVMFYTTKRVGGGLENPECMKFMKIAAA
ncbi:phage major capsid protein [Massilia oculi]|uniref:Phage major capsid protein n=1 Tax=Massilia hydrophila TaxID=3044279 RepID=A0ABS7YCL6_9BURK|nr:phage major capsid protein [Massilia oculi]MCA1857447.1 phage major capsid protein [Massilia oculi]